MKNDEEIARLIRETLQVYKAQQEEAKYYPYGRVNDISDRFPGLASLKEVLELIPKEEKLSFIEACRRCPELVRIESEPVAFLRKEDYNVWAAARRLVKYWETRQEIFGDKAFLPLNLSGHGALGPDEVTALKTGFQAILPPDGLGRPVLFFDLSGLSQEISEQTLIRTMFFMHCVVSQSEVGQKYGYTGLTIYDEAFVPMQGAIRTAFRYVEQACPIFPCSIYVIRVDKKSYFEMIRALDPNTEGISKNLNMIVAGSPQEICSKMEKHHLHPESLPSAFGGKWDESRFGEWIGLQSSLKFDESYTKVGTHSLLSSPSSLNATGSKVAKNTSLEQAEMDLYEAIDLLPDEQKSAYLEAMELCPDLVTRESHPKKFLRCEANDPSAAARRLVGYWDLRRDLFEERAFCPMDATGKGALTKEEVGRLDRGFIRILPADVQGRRVIWWDRSKMTAVRSIEDVLCWWFYMLSVAAEERVAQEKGCILVAVYHPKMYKTPIKPNSKNTVTQMISKAIPFSPRFECHVVALKPEGEEFDPKLFALFLERVGRNVTTHIAPTTNGVANDLRETGFTLNGIPVEYGGQWQRAADLSWRAQRDLLENGRYLALACDPKNPGRLMGARKASAKRKDVIASGSGAEEVVLRSLQAMPGDSMVDFKEASRLDPDLVAQETNFARYLVVEKGDSAGAAEKVVNYWKMKRELCGEKFLVPLNSLPQSAISPMEIPCLGDGSMVRLLCADPDGNDALYIEDSCTEGEGWKSGLFFALSAISSMSRAREGAFSVLVRATKPMRYKECIKTLIEIAEKILPMRVKGIHLVFQKKESQDEQGQQLHPGWVHDLVYEMNDGIAQRTFFYPSDDEDDTLESLARLRFSRSTLVTVLGSQKQMVDPLELWAKAPLKESTHKQGIANQKATDRVTARGNAESGKSSVESLEEAISMLPEDEKLSYLQAQKEAPEVVESDSNPLLFLKYENFNSSNAAQRLTTYWRKRCEIFKERAFLPLNQTGEGALSKKDVVAVSTGYVAFLPNDDEDRTVICLDATRMNKYDPVTRMRNLFYWNHVAIQNEVSVEKGVVVIINLNKVSLDNCISEVVEFSRSAFPTYVHSVHVVPKCGKKSAFLEEAIPHVLELFPGTNEANQHVHVCTKKNEIVKNLTSHGLSKEAIPENLGGDWSYEKFAIWQEFRIRIEWDLPLGTLDEAGDSYAKPMSELTEAERVERKRRYNILHSRRKRRRDRVETEVLQRQVDELQEEHEDLAGEKTRLERLLVQANRLIASVENSHKAAKVESMAITSDMAGPSNMPAPANMSLPNSMSMHNIVTMPNSMDIASMSNNVPMNHHFVNAVDGSSFGSSNIQEFNATFGNSNTQNALSGSERGHQAVHEASQGFNGVSAFSDGNLNNGFTLPYQGSQATQGFSCTQMNDLRQCLDPNSADMNGSFGHPAPQQEISQSQINPGSSLQNPSHNFAAMHSFQQQQLLQSQKMAPSSNNNMNNGFNQQNTDSRLECNTSLQYSSCGNGSTMFPGQNQEFNQCFGMTDNGQYSPAQMQQFLCNNTQENGMTTNNFAGLGMQDSMNQDTPADQFLLNQMVYQNQQQQQFQRNNFMVPSSDNNINNSFTNQQTQYFSFSPH